MYEMGYKKVALISYQNDFSKIHHDTFVSNFKGSVVKDIVITNNSTDVAPDILKLKDSDIDAIFSTDIAFFFANGLDKLRRIDVTVPVFSQYAVELPAVRSLVDGVMYSFPDGVDENEGAVFGMAKDSAVILSHVIEKCGEDTMCAQSVLKDQFTDGVIQRNIILKKIQNGIPTRI